MKLFNEKWDKLEEQQHHLYVGLNKLCAIVSQVEELCQSLALK